MTKSGLTLNGITHAFGERRVLDDVDFDVPAGRVVGLLGPNGAGKSTLMRITFGVIRPDRGEVCWLGRPASPSDRRSWGYMPQERGLYMDMRVRDQLVWLARLRGIDAGAARSRADDLLERLDLTQRAGDVVKELSGGMAQRVQLAAAMVHRPDLLVLDEPFSGLDPSGIDFLMTVLADHVRDGKYLVFSSHQLDLVEDICEFITVIDRGRVVLNGNLRDLRSSSTERYLGVDVAVSADWIPSSSAVIERQTEGGTRLRLAPGADAAGVLDCIRSHAPVTEFAVERPSLAELFRDATNRPDEGLA